MSEPDPSTRPERLRDRVARGARVGLIAAGLIAAALAVAVPAALLLRSEDSLAPAEVVAAGRGAADDPLAYEPGRREEFELRGAAGASHVLYEKSPGGAVASARRTARFREEIERAARRSGADPDLMEAMVFLESAGRPGIVAGNDSAAASGLAQIVASTGIDLLGMRIDLPRSRELTARIETIPAEARGLRARRDRLARRVERNPGTRKARRAERGIERIDERLRRLPRELRAVRRERAAIDERFQPRAAIEGMARYLRIARERFGREDLAIASYHMGIGNLEDVVRRYVRPGDASGPAAALVDRDELSYAALYFDSSPLRNARTWRLLSSFGDDSATYLWRVLGSRDILATYRSDRDELRRLSELYTAKATAEEAFHPESETEVFDDPDELERAWRRGEIAALPRSGVDYRSGRQIGELADELEVDRDLYRGLRPEALATLIYLSSRVRAISGRKERLVVTSAVRDRRYQDLLVARNPEATRNYSLHTTGWSFDIWRRYESRAQAEAFQFVLDRLRALAVLDYAVEPEAIHVTVSPTAASLDR